MKKRGLGKGLSALIGDNPMVETLLKEDEQSQNSINNIQLNMIITKDSQPRKDFNEESLADLSNSIKIHGVIQPILVRKIDDKYEIIAGERRFRASKMAGLTEIPCIVRDMGSEESAKIALIENIQREDLNPIEEAFAYKQLMEEYNLKQEDMGVAVGKSRTYITNTIRLLNLDQEVIEYIYDGKLTSGHGKALLGIKDKKEQLNAAKKIISFGLNVRETESEVKTIKDKPKKKTLASRKDPYIVDLEEDLMRALGTKVNLINGNKKGKIEIEYYNEDDLDRLLELLIS